MKEKVMLMIKRREQINEVEKLKENMMENNFILKLPKVINKALTVKMQIQLLICIVNIIVQFNWSQLLDMFIIY